MKAIKTIDNDLLCRYENAIYLDDESYILVDGDYENGYVTVQVGNIDELIKKEPDGWTTLNPSISDTNNEYSAIAGDTSYAGCGFIALKLLEPDSFKWIIHLSNLNNPIDLRIENDFVNVTSDLNYPNGVIFKIPISKPKNIITEYKK